MMPSSLGIYVRSLRTLPFLHALKVVAASVTRHFFKQDTEKDAFVQMEVVKWVLRRGGAVRSERNGLLIFVHAATGQPPVQVFLRKATSDFYVFRQVFMEEEYHELVPLIENRSAELQIIDAGANIGTTTLWLKSNFPNARIISVEADQENFHCLARNIDLNRDMSGLMPLYRALWINEDELAIHSDFRDGKSHSKSVSAEGSGVRNVKGIKASQLKSMLSGEINIFKIDIEGAEQHLFNDEVMAAEVLENVKVVAIELHPEWVDEEKVVDQFRRLGYQGFHRGETYFFSKKR